MAIPESYPDEVRAGLQRMLDGFDAAEPAPVALLVYGSLAKGTYRPGQSEVNVAVILEDSSNRSLSAVREPLRAGWRSIKLRPYLLTRDELPRLADVFPIKIADLAEHHDVLRGDEPFKDVVVERADMRLRIEQQLRHHLTRLRRHYIHAGDNDSELAKVVFGSASALGVELTALLRVCGESSGAGTLESVRGPVTEAFGMDGEMLDRLCAFRRGEKEDDIPGLFFGLVELLERAVQIADELDVSQ